MEKGISIPIAFKGKGLTPRETEIYHQGFNDCGKLCLEIVEKLKNE